MVNPTEVPEFEMPFMLVPVPAFVPAVGPSKLVNYEAAGADLVDECDGRAGDLMLRLVVLVSLDVDLRGDARVVQVMGHRGVEQRAVFQRDQDRAKATTATGSIG